MKEIEKFGENLPKHFGHILACEVIGALPNFFGGQTSKSRARQSKCYRESSFTRGRHNEDGMRFYLNEINIFPLVHPPISPPIRWPCLSVEVNDGNCTMQAVNGKHQFWRSSTFRCQYDPSPMANLVKVLQLLNYLHFLLEIYLL